MLAEEARRDHARAVVHEALAEELARGGVDDGVAGRSRPPTRAMPPRPSARESPPTAGGTAARAPRARAEDVVRELAPDELVREGAPGLRVIRRGPSSSRCQADRAERRAELEVLRDAARAGDAHRVAALVVLRGGALQESRDARPRRAPRRRRRPARYESCRSTRASAACRGASSRPPGCGGSGGSVFGAGRGAPMVTAFTNARENGVKTAEGRPRSGEHLTGRGEGLSLEELETRAALLRERLRDTTVALDAERLAPAMRDDARRRERARELGNDVDALAVRERAAATRVPRSRSRAPRATRRGTAFDWASPARARARRSTGRPRRAARPRRANGIERAARDPRAADPCRETKRAYASGASPLLSNRRARHDPHGRAAGLRRRPRDVDPVREAVARRDARVDPRAHCAALRGLRRVLPVRAAAPPPEATQAQACARGGDGVRAARGERPATGAVRPARRAARAPREAHGRAARQPVRRRRDLPRRRRRPTTAIEAAIREAKHHVHVAYYIFEPGRGRRALPRRR